MSPDTKTPPAHTTPLSSEDWLDDTTRLSADEEDWWDDEETAPPPPPVSPEAPTSQDNANALPSGHRLLTDPLFWEELNEMRSWADDGVEQAVNAIYDAKLGEAGVKRGKTVERRNYEWLWHGRLLKRKLHLMAGDGDLGKSWLAMDMAARISAGLPWPDGTVAPRGSVLYISAEDDADDTILPRIEAMGGDLDRVFFESIDDTLTLDDGANKLGRWILLTGATFVVLDPLSAFLGGLSLHSGNGAAIRQALSPLRAVATREGAAVLSIMHLNKNNDQSAGQRVSGSADFKNVVRLGFMVTPDPDDTAPVGDPARRRFFATLKKNLVSTPPPTLAYHTEPDPTDEAKGRVIWEGPVLDDFDLEAVLRGTNQAEQRRTAEKERKIEVAKAFLKEYLANGQARMAGDGTKEATAQGIGKDHLAEARTALGVVVERVPNIGDTVWTWRLPKTS